MLNSVQLIGHLGKDPELKYSASGNPVCNLSLATDEGYTDKDGNKVEKAEWHRLVAYQRLAETCGQYLHKGSKVYVSGKLQTRKWQDQSGQDRYTTEVVANRVLFLDGKGQDQSQGKPQAPRTAEPNNNGPAFPSETGGMDDVPF